MTDHEPLARTTRAIHTLFYATEEAGERYKTLEASIKTDEELAAFQALGIALINFDPLPPDVEAGLMAHVEEIERREAEAETKAPNGRISIEAHDSDEGRYVERLLAKMYANWDGTLDYESGRHRFAFYSPFDPDLRRHTSFAYVSVDGDCPDLTARSYILGPYLRVFDERTKLESDDPWKILGGDLTPILPVA